MVIALGEIGRIGGHDASPVVTPDANDAPASFQMDFPRLIPAILRKEDIRLIYMAIEYYGMN